MTTTSSKRRRDDDDLIGDVTPPTSEVRNIGEELSLRTADVHTLGGGVSIAWMMKAFRMGRGTIEKRLLGCQPIGQGKHGTPLYDLPEAASYLVRPRLDSANFLKTLKPEDLPEKLREPYWNAKLKEQRFRERAGHLWRTDRVLSLFAGVLQDIRSKMQIIPDSVARELGLTPDQVRKVERIIDDVQDEIHKEIKKLSSTSHTPNQLGEEEDDEDLI